MFVIKTDRACTDTSLPILKRDTLLEGDNGGVKWLVDLASKYSYPAQAAPVNGTLSRNLDESGNNGAVVVQSGDVVGYAGRGLDFTGVTKAGNHLTGPAAPLASIWASANQYYTVCAYLKLPTLANWNSAPELHDMIKFADTHYFNGPDLVLIAQQSGGSLSVRRQTALGVVDGMSLAPQTADYGSFVQLAFWRDATGQFARIKSANGVASASGAVGANNSLNFSALIPQVGVTGGLKTATGVGISTAHQNAAKYRLYRAWVENLALSGRSATAVLDADYARTVARGVFS